MSRFHNINTVHILNRTGLVFLCLGCTMLLGRQIVRAHLYNGRHEFFPPAGYSLNSDAKSFKFAIVGDTGHNDRILTHILEDVVSDKPDFIIYIGDLVKGTATEHFSHMSSVVSKAVGDIPVYFTPGNHDITISHSHKELDTKPYSRRFGQSYYWFGYGDTLFISLDSSSESISAEQWKFYEMTMRHVRPAFRRAIVYTHVPPINPVDKADHKQADESIERMAHSIKKFKPDAIFTGHVHYWSVQDFYGVPVYSSPSAGQPSHEDNNKMGYLTVNIDKTGIRPAPTYVDDLPGYTDRDNSWQRNLLETTEGKTSKRIWLLFMFSSLVLLLGGSIVGHNKNKI